MKETILVCLGLLFVFFPWMIGIVDVLSWALFGSQLTNIPWEAGRGALLVLWPVAAIGGIAVTNALISLTNL